MGPADRRAHLRELLTAFAPADAEEHAHCARMLELTEAAGDPFARDHFAPGHFTASGFVLAPEGDALFFIHHRKLDRWLQPGGHIEPGDADVLAAARREVAEEVGLLDAALAPGFAQVFDVDVHPIPARPDEPAHEHFDVRFVFQAPARDAVSAGDEVKGGRWLTLDEVTAEATDESVARAGRKLRRR
jgi:8-oxo-dGTP pyrophosphatase MutT (NUDIX family)